MKEIKYKNYLINIYYDDDFASYYFSVSIIDGTGLGYNLFYDGLGCYVCATEAEAEAEARKFIKEI